MSYKDLDTARAARAAKDKAAAEKGKGKRGRKRKVPAREVEGDTEDEVEGGAYAGSSMCATKDKMEQTSNVFHHRVRHIIE